MFARANPNVSKYLSNRGRRGKRSRPLRVRPFESGVFDPPVPTAPALDHNPSHLHAYVGSTRLVIELTIDHRVILARRANAARGATKSEIRKVLETAAAHFADLMKLWEKAHEQN